MAINSINHTNTYKPYVDNPDDTHQPGILQLFRAPRVIKKNIAYIFHSEKKFDGEGAFDIKFRLQRAFFSFLYSFCTVLSWVNLFIEAIRRSQFLVFGGQFFKFFTPFLGIFLTCLEAGSELVTLSRLNRLKEKITHYDDHHHLVRLQRAYFKIHPHESEDIKKYIQAHHPQFNEKESLKKFEEIGAKFLIMKEGKLARRIRPWLAAKIQKEHPVILGKLQNRCSSIRNEGNQAATTLVSEVRNQVDHHKKMRCFGIISLALILVGLIASLSGAPLLVVLLIGLTSTAMGRVRKHYGAKLTSS